MTTTNLPLSSAALTEALTRIPPLWPLNHFVAVNPFLGLADRPFTEACAILQRTVGVAPLQSSADYLAAFSSGVIQLEDLETVADAEWTPEQLISALKKLDQSTLHRPIATMADLLDSKLPHAHWSVFIVEEISKWCGVFFDQNQTTWTSPWKKLGLYTAWREAAYHDYNPESFGLTGFRSFVSRLPDNAEDCLQHCVQLIAPPQVDPTDFLHRQLATIAGWAGYVQYRVREDGLRGIKNPALQELLAIRLAYDAALFEAFTGEENFRAEWFRQSSPLGGFLDLAILARWQSAYEAGYQRRLAHALITEPSAIPEERPLAQAVFCIDVRSEVFRRHLEATLPGLQTIGFAGFFGFPVAHQVTDSVQPTSRCPVLLVPPIMTCEHLTTSEALTAKTRRQGAGAWKAFQNSATSCFSFVESVGLAFGAALGQSNHNHSGCCAHPAPAFTDTTLEVKANLAEGALRNMSLIKNFARMVLICGHGSQSANNPYASSLDCGACGGHAGDVNARLAAATLNDPQVRKLLAARGIAIPEDTVFLAGMHQTLSDDAVIFDQGNVPASHVAEIATLQTALAGAGKNVRRERAAALGLNAVIDAQIDGTIRSRAHDISQVRPEWGLAGNAALVAAPRSRTARLKLDGRVFLHDYNAEEDTEDKVLALILGAPVVVASWINLQYYASRVNPEHYGSGNKVLHNVLGGIGVMEGNSGDLKVGLPLQSIHDGENFVHEPRRLTVFIEATRARLDRALEAQPNVKQLFDHGWIYLVSLENTAAFLRTPSGWRSF